MEALSKDLSAEATTVDGLESMFEAVDPGVMTVSSDAQSTVDVRADSIVLWTLQDAAENLGLSTRTVLRKLKTGTLCGHKILGANGPEWRIKPVAIPPQPTTTIKPSVKTVTSDSSSTQDTPQDTTVQALLKVIESQAEQIKAASEVIMYQRDQLQTKDTHIKLLTDSQHKAGWWSRFCSWAARKPSSK
jgi:hypothetical protein